MCPLCGGEPIGHEVQGVYDGVLFWSCQKCGTAWERDGFTGRRAEIARSYIDHINHTRRRS